MCAALHKVNASVPSTGCGNFKPGDVNPYGLHVVTFSTSTQEQTPPISFLPHTMDYDLLSQSVVAVVSGYPPTKPAYTTDGQPILALIGFNETTGAIVDCPAAADCSLSATPFAQSLLFCKSCVDASGASLCTDASGSQICSPPPKKLPYDYTSVAYGASAVDTLNSTYYYILSNPSYAGSETLFAVRRAVFLSSGDDFTGQGRISSPSTGQFVIELQAAALFWYK